MRILYKILGGLMIACGAFMLLGFVAAWTEGNNDPSLGLNLVVLLCLVLVPFFLGFLLLKMNSTPRLSLALAPHASVAKDQQGDPVAVRNAASPEYSSSPTGSLLGKLPCTVLRPSEAGEWPAPARRTRIICQIVRMTSATTSSTRATGKDLATLG
jgi:hypothetical protein